MWNVCATQVMLFVSTDQYKNLSCNFRENQNVNILGARFNSCGTPLFISTLIYLKYNIYHKVKTLSFLTLRFLTITNVDMTLKHSCITIDMNKIANSFYSCKI